MADAKEKATKPQGFGITSDTKASNNISMLPPHKGEPNSVFQSGWKFPTANLVNIVVKENFETKNGNTTVLQFIFKDSKGRQYIHTEWAQDPTDEKYDVKMEGLNVRIKHMYMQFFPEFPSEGIGTKATSFAGYFTAIKEAFEANENLSKISCFVKLTFYKGNLGFPLSPNFLQRVIKDKPCLLEINPKYDKVTAEMSKPNVPGGIPGGAAGETDIDFDAEYD